MMLMDVMWSIPVNIIFVMCDCGAWFIHPTNYSLVRCPQCGCAELWHSVDPVPKHGPWSEPVMKQYLTASMECGIMPYRPGDPVFYFEAKIEVTTAKAYLLHPTMGTQKEVWCPKSQIVSMGEPDENGNRMFEVTEWWFEKSGMVNDA